MNGEDILILVEDLQRECMNRMSDEVMACLDKIHKYIEQESERDNEIARLTTRAFIAERSFDKYKSEVGQAI